MNSINLERDADEIAALAMILAGIVVVTTSVFAQLFWGATIEVQTVEKLGGLLILGPAGYLFGKGNPNK